MIDLSSFFVYIGLNMRKVRKRNNSSRSALNSFNFDADLDPGFPGSAQKKN